MPVGKRRAQNGHRLTQQRVGFDATTRNAGEQRCHVHQRSSDEVMPWPKDRLPDLERLSVERFGLTVLLALRENRSGGRELFSASGRNFARLLVHERQPLIEQAVGFVALIAAVEGRRQVEQRGHGFRIRVAKERPANRQGLSTQLHILGRIFQLSRIREILERRGDVRMVVAVRVGAGSSSASSSTGRARSYSPSCVSSRPMTSSICACERGLARELVRLRDDRGRAARARSRCRSSDLPAFGRLEQPEHEVGDLLRLARSRGRFGERASDPRAIRGDRHDVRREQHAP